MEQDFTARLFVKIIFTKSNFHKIHADFYGDLDVNFVVIVFDPNMPKSENGPKGPKTSQNAHLRFYAESTRVVTTVYHLLPRRRKMSSLRNKCEVSEDKHKDRRKMESFAK